MGLNGRMDKQRLSSDPQNKRWADDKSKLGFKLLSKMGWSDGQGLGVHNHGISEHVKVTHKKDNLGVGADHKTIDNWIQHTSDFDALLAGLNKLDEDESTKAIESTSIDKKKIETGRGVVATSGRSLHRSRWLKNKSVSNYDAEAMNQILGLRASTGPPATPPKSEGKGVDNNMTNYFQKMMASKGVVPTTSMLVDVGSDDGRMPVLGLGYSNSSVDVTGLLAAVVNSAESLKRSRDDEVEDGPPEHPVESKRSKKARLEACAEVVVATTILAKTGKKSKRERTPKDTNLERSRDDEVEDERPEHPVESKRSKKARLEACAEVVAATTIKAKTGKKSKRERAPKETDS